MEGYSSCIFTDRGLPTYLKLWLVGVVPDHDVAVRACDDQMLAQTRIHASNRLVMERAVHILTSC